MPQKLKISDNGIAFIKQWEHFAPNEYFCEAGKRTIGYGHVILYDDQNKVDVWDGRKDKGIGISENYANILLMKDLEPIQSGLCYKVKSPLGQNQYDALCSLIYNIGLSAFFHSKGFKFLNAANYDLAATEFFDRKRGFVQIQGKISNGLVNRRAAEKQLWSMIS